MTSYKYDDLKFTEGAYKYDHVKFTAGDYEAKDENGEPHPSQPDYKYDKLDGNAIRLMILEGGESKPIRCKLIQTSLDLDTSMSTSTSKAYDALSYTWITHNPCTLHRIKVDEQDFYTTTNLHDALLSLRAPFGDKVLWIDAICINQDDKEEKTRQVQQMRLVYEHARCVIFWLGGWGIEADTNRFMDLVSSIHEELLEAPPGLDAKGLIEVRLSVYRGRREHWTIQAAIDLVARPYFRRVWIVQEVVSAQRGMIMCGSRSVPAETFVFVMRVLLGDDMTDHVRAILDIMPGPRREESWYKVQPDLFTLLTKFRQSDATDIRDKVYALIGISSDAGHDGLLQPDYRCTLSRFVHNTVSYLFPRDIWSMGGLPQWTASELCGRIHELPQQLFDWAWIMENVYDMIRLLSPNNKRNTGWRHHIEVDAKNAFGRTPLSWAAGRTSDKKNETLATLLLNTDKVDPDSKDNSGRTALSWAAEKGSKGMIQLLLNRKGVDPDSKDNSGRTPLSWAAEKGQSKDILKMLIGTGKVDPESKDDSGRTPRAWAAEHEWVYSKAEILEIFSNS